jgi:glycerol-3-phosphate acyltransferase PlsY
VAALVRPPAAWGGAVWWPYARGAFEFALGAFTVSVLAGSSPWSQMLVATAAVAGRLWPLIGRDAHAKGILMAGGAMFTINPVSAVLWGLLWGVGFVTTGFRTAGAVIATLALPLALGLTAGWAFGGIALPLCVMVLDRQRGDLRRMFLGGERKHYWRSEA